MVLGKHAYALIQVRGRQYRARGIVTTTIYRQIYERHSCKELARPSVQYTACE